MTDNEKKLDAKLDQAAGSIKETAGRITGDKEVETEGRLQGADGRIAEKIQDAKDVLKGVADHLKGDKD